MHSISETPKKKKQFIRRSWQQVTTKVQRARLVLDVMVGLVDNDTPFEENSKPSLKYASYSLL